MKLVEQFKVKLDKLGLDDDNFLSRELSNHDAEDFKLQLTKYEEALRQGKDTNTPNAFDVLLGMANTKILYLIYR